MSSNIAGDSIALVSTPITASPLAQIGGAHGGVAPANLLDLQTVAGNVYYWADRKLKAPCVVPPVNGNTGDLVSYSPWVLSAGALQIYRSLQVTTGSFLIQNISGDSMARDVEKILRAGAIEGALCVYRIWEGAAQAARREVHGKVTADQITETELSLKFSGLFNASEGDAPQESYSETCQLLWGSARCGATGAAECQYSFQSCQVVERFTGTLNSYEKNWGEATLTLPATRMNRARKI